MFQLPNNQKRQFSTTLKKITLIPDQLQEDFQNVRPGLRFDIRHPFGFQPAPVPVVQSHPRPTEKTSPESPQKKNKKEKKKQQRKEEKVGVLATLFSFFFCFL